MKYAIDTLIAVLSADDKESIDRILYGDPYEVFKESESSEPMEEAEAREAFSKLHATARRKEDDGEPPSRISRDVCLLTQACMEGRRDVKFFAWICFLREKAEGEGQLFRKDLRRERGSARADRDGNCRVPQDCR